MRRVRAGKVTLEERVAALEAAVQPVAPAGAYPTDNINIQIMGQLAVFTACPICHVLTGVKFEGKVILDERKHLEKVHRFTTA